MFKKENIDSMWIWNEEFKGVGTLLTTNTKNYVDTPGRMNDGSMPNLPDHDSFIVPRAKFTFPLLKIEDYQRLCRCICQANEFPVTYFDKQIGEFVTHNMYCEPEEMSRLFNIGSKIVGVLGYEISFIGTLNNLQTYQVEFYLNKSALDFTVLHSSEFRWSDNFIVLTGSELVARASSLGVSVPTKTFLGWNTKRDGTGIWYYPNVNVSVFENMKLYAQWSEV